MQARFRREKHHLSVTTATCFGPTVIRDNFFFATGTPDNTCDLSPDHTSEAIPRDCSIIVGNNSIWQQALE